LSDKQADEGISGFSPAGEPSFRIRDGLLGLKLKKLIDHSETYIVDPNLLR
jgi:hypothetical protein